MKELLRDGVHNDREALLKDLIYDNKMMSLFVDNTEVGMYVVDFYTCEILFANSRIGRFFGASAPMKTIGKRCWEVLDENNTGRCSFCKHQQLLDDSGHPIGPYVWENYLPKYDVWLKVISEAITWVDGRLAQMVTFYDITETKKLQNQLVKIAYTDQLLDLPNCLKLEADIEEAEVKPSLMFFDIVSLQKVNDAYGRDIGDSLLKSIRDWIVCQGIPESTLYRFGGDEFCLVVGRISENALRTLAYNLSCRFNEPWVFENAGGRLHIFCNATIGVIHSDFVSSNEPLLNLIDRTLKTAKETGKITVYDEQMKKEFKRRLQFEMILKRCVRENMDGFDVHYQPIADPITGMWCGLEALCRWNSPELGIVSPNLFIPEAERLELIGAIGLWALETAVHKCKCWGLDKNRKFILDVNLSAIQFTDETLAEKILDVLKSYDFPGEKLCLEITESTQFTFNDLSLQTIQRLREQSILVALDDFGTGYSGFNNLKSLPIDIVKIERVFVNNIENDSYQQYLFHAMSELAHAADMKLVAEGVENREQVDILLKNGADYLQGYLLSKPLPPDQLEANLGHFYDIDPSFSVIRSRKIDIKQLLDIENNYILTPNLYKVLNRGMRILFYHADPDEAIEQVLRIVGSHMDVSRTYVFLRDHDNCYSNTHEWCADGIMSQKKFLSNIDIRASWLDSLRNDGIILTSDISNLETATQDILKIQGIKAIVVIPLWDNDELLGFVGIDDCRYFRDWRPEEIILLHNLSVVITSLLSKRMLKCEITQRGEILNETLNHIEMPIYVTDPDTGKILFANKNLREMYGDDVYDRMCWEVAHGRKERCKDCKIEHLKKSKAETEVVWEYKNQAQNKTYQVHESLIPWLQNKMAHLEYSIDITQCEREPGGSD